MNFLKSLALVVALGASALAHAGDLVNINTASAELLAEAINGVGKARAARIVAYRERHGPFRSIDELAQVRGIGQATIDRSRNRLTVSVSGHTE